jgi:phage-related protein (TIGR01555 family)
MSEDLKKSMLQIQNELQTIQNGPFSQAILGYNPGGIGTQLSQVDTMFKNNRWYLVSNMRQLLSEIYVELGLVQTVIDVPVNDAFRGGVEIKSKELDDDDISELENVQERNGDMKAVIMANKWNRLFGGAGILIMTDQKPDEPLDIESIKRGDKVEFRGLDMWELFWSKQNTSDYSAVIDGNYIDNTEFYDYYGKRVHRSRVLKLKGLEAPSFIRPRLRGWGFSIMESLVRSINQYLKATDLTFEVLDEFKVDIFKINGLASTLAMPNGYMKVQERIQLANQEKNFNHALTMDAEDDWMQKQLSFAGIAEVMDGIRKQVASDLRMPISKLFGVSSAGFSSGEDDIENYNAMVESTVRSTTKFEILKVIEIRCQQLFGFVPDDLAIDFKPLRVLSSEQEEAAKTQRFNRLLQARQAGEISSKDFKEGCNLADLLPVKVKVDDKLFPTASGSGEAKPLAAPAPRRGVSAPIAKNSEGIRNVGVMALICDGRILTGRRRDNGKWVFPGGSIEPGETPLEGACRECKEECGIENVYSIAEPIPIKKVTSESGEELRIHAYIARMDNREMPKTTVDPDEECDKWEWVPLSPDTPELQPENRHAKNDVIIDYFKGGNE